MTKETKTFFDFADLLAIEMTCSCGSAVSFVLDAYKQLPIICQNCNQKLLEMRGTDAATLESLIAYIRMAKALKLPNAKVRVQVREIPAADQK